jgi:hypothetical protein
MSNLVPIDVPDLQPLRESFEYDQFESELKSLFVKVFNDTLRESERSLNLTGMPHLGDEELMARALKFDGVAIVMRSAERMEFMLKATRSRNERRGLMYLKKYLQAIWPNVWLVEPLWQPLSSAIYPDDAVSLAKPKDLGSGVTAEYDADGNPSVYRTDSTGKNLLYSTPRTNYVRNNTMQGAAVGVFPTNWSASGPAGIAPSIVGTGTDGGVSYVDVRFAGTAGAAGTLRVYPENVGVVAAATGEAWVYSLFCKLQAGSLAPVTLKRMAIEEFNSSPTFIRGSYSNFSFTSSGLSTQRYSLAATLSGGAATASIRPFILLDVGSGAVVDITLRIGMPQLEKGAVATSVIPTTSAAVTVTDYAVATNGVATFASGPAPSPLLYFRTGRIRVTLPVTADNGLGLAEIARAFRSTLAARLMLLLQLGIVFENIGANGGLALSNAAIGIMPFTAIGTLQGPSPP